MSQTREHSKLWAKEKKLLKLNPKKKLDFLKETNTTSRKPRLKRENGDFQKEA